MNLYKICAFVSTGVLGTLGGAYKFTLKPISTASKDLLPESIEAKENGIWKKAYENWKKSNLKDNPLFSNIEEDSKGENFKNACINAYSSTYWSIFKKSQDELLNSAVKHCSISIEDAIEPLRLVKNEIEDTLTEPQNQKSKDWCNGSIKKKYIGETEEFNEIKKYCLKDKGN